MDARLQAVLAAQLASRFAGLSGSDAQATLRMADRLLNESIAASLPPDGPLRSAVVHSLEGNRFDAIVTLTRPAFLPPLHVHLAIERGFILPQEPVLVLRITGGAGGLLKLAAPMLGSAKLPPGLRLDGDRLFVDVRAALAARGHAKMLDFVRDLQFTTEDSTLVVRIAAAVP